VPASLNLTCKGSVLAREGCGYLLTFEGLANTSLESDFCFNPLMTGLTTSMYVILRKHQTFTRAGEIFLEELKTVLDKEFSFANLRALRL